MKKRVLYSMALLMSVTALAQTPPAQRDTIYGREVTYHYIPQWHDEDFPGICPLINVPLTTTSFDEYAQLIVVDTPMTIIGIAACPMLMNYENGDYSFRQIVFNDTDWTHSYDYLRLYEHKHDSMIMMREEIFNLADTSRWMKFCDSANAPHNPHIFPVVERYFADPIRIEDSCYVACTEYNSLRHPNQDNSCDHFPISYQNTWGTPSWGQRPIAVRMLGGRWYFREYCNQVFLFAIIDTTGMGLGPHVEPCGPVENLRVASVWDNNALVMWDGAPEHLEWEVAVGKVGPENLTSNVITVRSPSKVMSFSETNFDYFVRVRGRCVGSENFGEWSDTVHITFTHGGQPEEVREVADRYTYLVPNPAGETVTVASSFELRYVSVYDMSGQQVFDKECTGHAVTLNVSDWPDGIYIVVIRNQQGTSAKKLVVSR